MDDRRSRDLMMLIENLGNGRQGAFEALSASIYDQLRAMARHRLQRRFGAGMAGVTFHPTEVAHEVLMRLMKQKRTTFANSDQFWAIVNIQLKRVLIDYYRRRKPKEALEADGEGAAQPEVKHDGEAVAKALDRLRELDARKADVIVCRFFFDLTIAEVADSLGISHATVERDTDFAKAWLADELRKQK